MKTEEIQYLRELIQALERKCKTEALYLNCKEGLRLLDKLEVEGHIGR